MYQAYGLLKPDSDFTLAAAATRLAGKFPQFSVERKDDALSLFSADWEIHLTLVAGPQVLAESRTLEERIGGAQDDIGLSTCARRVEVASDFDDPEMEHFNDYLKVIEVLQSFKGLIAVDPKEPSLL